MDRLTISIIKVSQSALGKLFQVYVKPRRKRMKSGKNYRYLSNVAVMGGKGGDFLQRRVEGHGMI